LTATYQEIKGLVFDPYLVRFSKPKELVKEHNLGHGFCASSLEEKAHTLIYNNVEKLHKQIG
jgi:hypothetical protein